jgi:nitrite reductase/ring-hydroxylating ferredoxin subunit
MTSYSIPVPELEEGRAAVVEVQGRKVLLCRSAAGIHATSAICPHQHKGLDGARVRNGALMCPHHGARFSLEDGRSLSPLTPRGLTLYRVGEDAGTVTVEID